MSSFFYFLRQKYFSEAALVSVLSLILAVYFFGLFREAMLIVLIGGTILGIIPVYLNAVKALGDREWASMDMLASVALTFSLIQREWTSAVFICLMLAAARLLGKVTEDRTEKSMRSLLSLRPPLAKVEREGKTFSLPAEQILLGDIVVADVGERIAIDGVVLSGQGTVDESALTGESMPVDKIPGNEVSSSTLVSSGSFRIETKRIGKDTTLERIIALIESSKAEKPAIETLGQRFGKLYLTIMFFGAVLLLLYTHDFSLVLAVVLVVCADDIAIAIPLAYLMAIGSATKRGIVVKGGLHLETLGRADTVIFDKTGTLTRGKPEVHAVVAAENVSEKELLECGMTAVRRSNHPLSKALLRYAEEKKIVAPEADSAEVVGGMGVIASLEHTQIVIGRKEFILRNGIKLSSSLLALSEEKIEHGQSVLYVAKNGEAIGFAAFGDEIRSEAKAALFELRKLGIRRFIMLSGDNERAAGAIAEELGIDLCFANLFPEEKVQKLKELRNESIVIMVGDGVNDAAALSIAHVGIAMGGLGSDGAIESANIVLMRDNLSAIPETIRLARFVRRISIENFYIWGSTNIVGLALVFTGVIGPVGAAAYNFLSDFFPLINSIRARIPKKG